MSDIVETFSSETSKEKEERGNTIVQKVVGTSYFTKFLKQVVVGSFSLEKGTLRT